MLDQLPELGMHMHINRNKKFSFLPEICCSGFISSVRSAWSSTVLVPVFSTGLGSSSTAPGRRISFAHFFIPTVMRKNRRGLGSDREV